MTIPEHVMQKAIEGGYHLSMHWFNGLPEYAHAQFIVDKTFWQALGKALDMIPNDPNIRHDFNSKEPAEGCPRCQAMRFYHLILTGGDTEKFWADLLAN